MHASDNNDNFAFTVTKKGSSNTTYNWPFQVVPSNQSSGLYYIVFGPADKRGTFLVNIRLIAPTLETLLHSPFAVDVSWGIAPAIFALFYNALTIIYYY